MRAGTRGPRRLEYSADLSFTPEDDGRVRFTGTATTGRRLKLERTRIRDEAWTDEVIAQFMRNPVATFRHNSDYPLGLYESVVYADGQLSVEGWISAKAMAPTQETFGELVRDGRLRGLSVTIDVIDYEDTPEGTDFTEIELWEIALTPTPRYSEALMTQVNSRDEVSQQIQEQTEDNMEEIRKVLGLAEDADEAAVVAAIGDLKTAATPKETQENAKPKKSERELELEAKVAELEAKDLVGQYSAKITEPLRPWALEYARKDPQGFVTWAKAAPASGPPQGRVVSHSRLETEAPDRGLGKVSEALGITDEDTQKFNRDNVRSLQFGKAGR